MNICQKLKKFSSKLVTLKSDTKWEFENLYSLGVLYFLCYWLNSDGKQWKGQVDNWKTEHSYDVKQQSPIPEHVQL